MPPSSFCQVTCFRKEEWDCNFIAKWVLSTIGNFKWIQERKAAGFREKRYMLFNTQIYKFTLNDMSNLHLISFVSFVCGEHICVCVFYCPLRAVYCRIPYIQTPGIESRRRRTSHISHTHIRQEREQVWIQLPFDQMRGAVVLYYIERKQIFSV